MFNLSSWWLYAIGASIWGMSLLYFYNKGTDRCIVQQQQVLAAQLKEQSERHEEDKKRLKEQYDEMLGFNKEVEVQVQERIVYRDRWRTKVEQVIANNPDSCNADPERVQSLNQLIDETNTKLRKP